MLVVFVIVVFVCELMFCCGLIDVVWVIFLLMFLGVDIDVMLFLVLLVLFYLYVGCVLVDGFVVG